MSEKNGLHIEKRVGVFVAWHNTHPTLIGDFQNHEEAIFYLASDKFNNFLRESGMIEENMLAMEDQYYFVQPIFKKKADEEFSNDH